MSVERKAVYVTSVGGGNDSRFNLVKTFTDGAQNSAGSIDIPHQSGNKQLDALRAQELNRQTREWEVNGILPKKTIVDAVPDLNA